VGALEPKPNTDLEYPERSANDAPKTKRSRAPGRTPSNPRGTRLPVVGDHANLCIAVLAGESSPFVFDRAIRERSQNREEFTVNENYRTRGSGKSFYEARSIPGDPARRYVYREVPRRVAGSEVALRVGSRMYPSRSRSLHGASRWRRDSPLSPTDIFISDEAACAHKKSTRRAIRSPINTSVTSATPALGSLRTRNPAGRRGRAANRCEVLIRVPSSPLPSRSAGECRPRLVHGHPKR